MANPDRTKALALYRRACTTHKRTDWRLACHALASVVDTLQPTALDHPPAHVLPSEEPKPSLIKFLSKAGICDPGGELSAIDAEIYHKGKPFQRRLVRDDGVTLEHAAEAAWEAGFFPDRVVDWDDPAATQPVTEGELIEAIRQEMAGR